MHIDDIRELLTDYLTLFPDEQAKLGSLTARLSDSHEPFNNRSSFSGHGTGGAIVLSPDRSKILLIHHKSSGKWMQPGGHWDPEDAYPWLVARREVEEETSVHIAKQLSLPGADVSVPIDIDSHDIPARPSKNEPAHVHHDFRYVFLAADEALTQQEDEIIDAQWIAIDSDDPRLAEVMPSIVKMRHLKLI